MEHVHARVAHCSHPVDDDDDGEVIVDGDDDGEVCVRVCDGAGLLGIAELKMTMKSGEHY